MPTIIMNEAHRTWLEVECGLLDGRLRDGTEVIFSRYVKPYEQVRLSWWRNVLCALHILPRPAPQALLLFVESYTNADTRKTSRSTG